MLSSKAKKIAYLTGIAMLCFSSQAKLTAAENKIKLPSLSLYEKLVPSLDLSPDQKNKFKKIIKNYKTNRIRLTSKLKVAEVEFSELIENKTFDLTQIKSQVNLISYLKKKVAENFVAHLIKTKALLTDKQLFDYKQLIQKKP